MDFTKYKCPVCGESFKPGEDIVVCPDCGAPQHRECYENTGHCFYEDRHSEDFSFENAQSDDKTQEASNRVCPDCGHVNEEGAFFCSRCSAPLTDEAKANDEKKSSGSFRQSPPFGYPSAGMPAFDPLAGLDSEDEIADNVKVGEMARFVGKTTQYYLMVFSRIRRLGNSRFNFAAFLFSGLYFIYRKMTALGVVLTLINIALTVGEYYVALSPTYQGFVQSVLNAAGSNSPFYSLSLLSQYSSGELLLIYLPFIFSIIHYVIMFVSGFIANRTYCKHCTKKVNEIKSENHSGNLNRELEAKGGVNLPLAICFGVAVLAVRYITLFF